MLGIFIIASTPALRAGLRALIAQADAGWEVVGEASTVVQAAQSSALVAALVGADVVVLADATQVISLAGQVSGDGSQVVVVLTEAEPIARVVGALRALPLCGWGIVPADASADELRAAIVAASQGLVALPLQSLGQALAPVEEGGASTTPPVELEHPLTARELEVLERVSRGLPSKLIAHELAVSESTVKFHLSSIYAKLGVASRTEAVSRAAKLGLITL